MIAVVPSPHLNCDLPPEEARAKLVQDLARWIRSEPLAVAVSPWGGDPPLSGSAEELFAWYDAFSLRHWDFRGRRERDRAQQADLTDEQSEAAFRCATALGLIDAAPPRRREYDVLMILGGLLRACIRRPRYARHLCDRGTRVAETVCLGGYRPLGDPERRLAAELMVQADDELSAMVAGVMRAFEVTGPERMDNPASRRTNRDWQVVRFDDRADLTVIAAPSSQPAARRANTADTLRWWAQRNRAAERPGRSVLMITSTIYVPYQQAVATQILGLDYGLDAEIVGMPDKLPDLGAPAATFTPTSYLQEIRSAVRGNRALLAAASAPDGVSRT